MKASSLPHTGQYLGYFFFFPLDSAEAEIKPSFATHRSNPTSFFHLCSPHLASLSHQHNFDDGLHNTLPFRTVLAFFSPPDPPALEAFAISVPPRRLLVRWVGWRPLFTSPLLCLWLNGCVREDEPSALRARASQSSAVRCVFLNRFAALPTCKKKRERNPKTKLLVN